MPLWARADQDYDPEEQCVDHGDPYVRGLVRFDDAWMEAYHLDDVALARRIEQDRLTYELALLYAWWAL